MVRPFTDFLRDQRGGETLEELSDKLNELVAAVQSTGKKGKLVLTVEVEPVKGTGGQVVVSDDVVCKKPELTRGATIFFATPENNLSRRDPRQADLPGLRTVEAAMPEPTEIEGVSHG